jgi:hypothetical protein
VRRLQGLAGILGGGLQQRQGSVLMIGITTEQCKTNGRISRLFEGNYDATFDSNRGRRNG